MLTVFMSDALNQAARRRRQVNEIWRAEGYQGIANRVRRVAVEQLKPRNTHWEVRPQDVIAADVTRPFFPRTEKRLPGTPISLNWVTTPSAPGSGGHTTTFRMVKYLESRGFQSEVYFYDVARGDHKYYRDIARNHYGVECPIRELRSGIRDADAVIATSWPTAYAAFNARCAGKRFYFVQDYEPAFYPTGTNSLLAENTYRMGFHGITAGRWLAEKLSNDFEMVSDHFPFGCDTSQYFLKPASSRSGIAFYARGETPRRGLELGLLALEMFAKRHPQIEVHLFGDKVSQLPFKFVNHGLVPPGRLNDIYNQCFAALSLSLTNVSLVPLEMLAAGCIPVVNDAVHNRMVLDNSYVRYADPTPQALSAALGELVTSSDPESMARRAADSVVASSWDHAGAAVEAAFRRALDE